MQNRSLIYIIGPGRSGTTIMDIVLGNAEQAISLGEINRFFKKRGFPNKRESTDKVYKFWSPIRACFEHGFKEEINYKELAQYIDKNEHHTSFFRAFFKGSDKKYNELTKKQYDCIFKHCEHNILIESSKYPIRALYISKLLKDESINIKYVYLKKNPVEVVNSFTKKNIEQASKGFIASNLYYLLINLICIWVFRILRKRGHQVFKVKYDYFIDHTDEFLNELSNTFDLNFEKSISKIRDKEPLETGYLFDGNRLRLQEKIFLKTNRSKNKRDLKNFSIRLFNLLVYR